MEKENSYHHSIDIPEGYDLDSDPCFIHRVPSKLRKVNESAYTPHLISIGPYNHGREELKAMERCKEKYRAELLKRARKSESDLREFAHKWSEEILESYEEGTVNKGIEGGLEGFEEMVARDSCFVLELLLRNYDDESREKDLILKTPWLRKAVKLDLILLENQLPFFFLQALFEFFVGFAFQKNPSPKPIAEPETKLLVHYNPLLHITSFFFEEHFLTESNKASFDEIEEIKHFTDLLRQFWLPREIMGDKRNTQESVSGNKYLYCATKLDSAGVTFEPMQKEKSLADVKIIKKPVLKFVPAINCMVLRLPELKIQCETECLIRNIMALELCLYPKDDYICGYVALMDQLINTKEDVDFLVDRKILTNLLGSNDEAAKLFNGLCCHIPRDKSYYARFHNELNAFYENSWNVTRATLKKVYFKDLWTGSSTVVGLFVLLFTVTATTRNVLR